MADKGKGPVIILFILLLAAIAAAAVSFRGLQKEKQTNQELSERISQLDVKKREADKQITDLRGKIEELKLQRDQQQAKLQEKETKLISIKDELETEKRAKEDALSQAEGAKGELGSLMTVKANLESELKTTKETLSNLQVELATLEKSKEALSQKPKEPEVKAQDVQLEKIVVTPSSVSDTSQPTAQAATSLSPLQGKVLVVNREYDFVVVNLGQKDNIFVSDMLEVFRNNKKICEMKVEEVRDTMSVATPVAKESIRQIKEDDKVVRKTG